MTRDHNSDDKLSTSFSIKWTPSKQPVTTKWFTLIQLHSYNNGTFSIQAHKKVIE